MKRLASVARTVNSTNRGLLEAAATLGLDALVLPPEQAACRLRAGDVALGRLDLLRTLPKRAGISALAAAGPSRLRELARHCRLDRLTISRQVQSLGERGLISRQPHASTRRAKTVEPKRKELL